MKVFNLLTACVIAAPLLFVSCNSDDTLTAPGSDAGGMSVTLTLGVSAGPADIASRADGDNYDMGLSGEREVNDAMLVIYDRPINYDGDDGKVVKVLYLPSPLSFTPSSDTTSPSYFDPVPSFYPQTDVLNRITVGSTVLSDACQKTFEVKDDILEIGKRYYAIALCNFGDMTSVFEGMSLKTFRDYVYTGALYDPAAANIKGYTNFRMTGINEESFIWERKTDGSLNLGQYLVQRLAARVDVSFGTVPDEFQNQDKYTDVGYMQLAVYTKAENATEYTISKDYSFYLTDIKIINASKKGTYLIERSAPTPPVYKDGQIINNNAVYLDNEAWENFSSGLRKPTKYVFSPYGTSKDYTNLDLVTESGYTTLCALIKGGNFFNDELASSYYDNKRNSSLVGYIPENTCSDYNTIMRIEGYTRAPSYNVFTGSRAPSEGFNLSNPTANGFKFVAGEIDITHNTDKNSIVMDNDVVRNTIYRLSIKVLANDNKIYFRYYFNMPGADSQREYTATAFKREVGENPNDDDNIND